MIIGPPPTATMLDKYGHHRRYTYSGRVFIIIHHGPEVRESTNTGEVVHGSYYDVWSNDGLDHVRCERVYGEQKAGRHIYDPSRAFRNMVNKAYQEGEIAWD